MKTETTMRRNTKNTTTTTRRSQNASNGYSGTPSLESVEAGQAWVDLKSRKGYRSNPLNFRRRRKVTSGGLRMSIESFETTKRKLVLYMRRHPEKTYLFVGASFAIALLIALVTSVFFHTNIIVPSNATSKRVLSVPSRPVKEPQQPRASPEKLIPHHDKLERNTKSEKMSIHMPVLKETIPRPKFEIVFEGTASSSGTIQMPKQLAPDELEALEWFDFGGLEIKFFEHDGASRNILHDYSLTLTDFRPRNKPHDDDVDM